MINSRHLDPGTPIIAVFGADLPAPGQLPVARHLGAVMNRAGAILLTGGDGADPLTVKDAAIGAANDAATEASPPSWVGVVNTPKAGHPLWHGPRSVVLRPGWGHRRNFVEACLCDGAIVVGGVTPGTASEELFCLFMGRPVVVASTEEQPVLPRNLRESARERIDAPTRSLLAVDRGIASAYRWAAEAPSTAYVQPLPRDEGGAGRLVAGLLSHITRTSPRLDINNTIDESGWDRYVARCLRERRR